MMMRQEELEALQKIFPFAPLATSYRMGWSGLQAVRYHESHIGELSAAGTTRTGINVIASLCGMKMSGMAQTKISRWTFEKGQSAYKKGPKHAT